MDNILNEKQINIIRGCMSTFSQNVREFCDAIDSCVTNFNRVPVVQSFFESGNYGNELKERLTSISQAVREYYEVICGANNLISNTRTALEQQERLINSSAKGGN